MNAKNPGKLDMDEIKKDKATQPVSLLPSGLKDREHMILDKFCVANEGVTLKEVLNPDYWRHVAMHLEFHTEITVQFADGSRWLKLLVVDCGPTWAKVKVLHDITLDEAETAEIKELREAGDDRYEVAFKGPSYRFCVVDKQTKEYMFKNGQNKSDAEKFLIDFKKTLNR